MRTQTPPSVLSEKVVLRDPAELKANKRNPRKHSEKQISQLIAAMQLSQHVDPVLVDDDDVILAGHGRVLALKRLAVRWPVAMRG